MAEADLGVKIQDFLRTEIGTLLVETSKQEVRLAGESLVNMDLSLPEAKQIQIRALAAQMIPQLLSEFINRGEQAYQQLMLETE